MHKLIDSRCLLPFNSWSLTSIADQVASSHHKKRKRMYQYGRQASDTLQRHGLAPKKRFGQNFLVHRRTAEAIVRAGEVDGEETIVEVGVGLGALTLPLAATAKQVFGFEIDSGLVRFHNSQQDLPDNVTLIHQDILRADFTELATHYSNACGRLKILANLPYSISNPFIFKLVDNAPCIDTVTVMLQKEVAQRLCAQKGSKEYGVPTILLASRATVIQHFTLKPEEFYPRPKIDSMVITLNFNKRSPDILAPEEYDFTLFKELVRTTFNQRRKTIGNTMTNMPSIRSQTAGDKKEMKRVARTALDRADISAESRPEALGVEKFVRICRELSRCLDSHR